MVVVIDLASASEILVLEKSLQSVTYMRAV